MKAIKLLFLLMAAFIVKGYSQSFDKEKLNQFFDRLAEKNKAMGSLVIAKDGSTVYTRTIGYSEVNGAEKKPLTAASRFRIGSVSKMFAATVVFQFIEEGKLQLTDTLAKFFPQIPNAGKISIEHLLAHRSGLPGIEDGSGTKRPKTKDEILGIIAQKKPVFEPGTNYAYSNTGYIVLGFIIEKITGRTYEQVLQEKIASKIGLKDTYRSAGFVDVSKNESHSYRYLGEWKQDAEMHLSIPGAAGAVISTPADQAKFIQALFDLKLISQKSLDHMIQNKMGMEPFTYNGKTFYGHTGGIDNFGSWLVYQPEEKLVVSYTTNAKVYPVGKIIDGVFDIYYNKPFTIPDFESMAISTEILDKYVGVYANPEAPVKFAITRDGAKLSVTLPNGMVVPLEPVSEEHFKIESLPFEFRFNAAKNEMTVIREGKERVFTKEK